MPSAGDLIRASHVADLYAWKTSSESVLNSTTLQDDDQLQIAVEASRVYAVQAVFFYDGSTTSDFKLKWEAPTSASFDWAAVPSIPTTATALGGNTVHAGQYALGTTISNGAVGVGSPLGLFVYGLLITSGTAGTFKATWAQATVDAVNATRVLSNSHMLLHNLSD